MNTYLRHIRKYEYDSVFHTFSKYVEIRPVVLGFLKYFMEAYLGVLTFTYNFIKYDSTFFKYDYA